MVDEIANPTAEETPARILIVDDVADNRAILGRRFERRGFQIAEADSGLGALDLIERETFDVVLLDVMMPDLDGREVLRRIRERHSDVELPVIMVTGRTESQDIVEALTAGANDYITKPVDFAVAMLRVSTQVGRRRAEEKARAASAALHRANEDLERRIAERTAELRQAMGEAQAANKAKDEFLVIVSHELRTPLNGMISMGQMLARTPLTDPQKRMADIINTSAGQLSSVVADLLDTLDLTSGALRLAPQTVALGDLIREAAAGAQARATEKGLAFHLEVDPSAEGAVEVDPVRLRQVLCKVLDNAFKFTEAGEVRLRVGRSADAAERLQIVVSDTGVGFDAATRERLFRPFEQADGSLTRRFGGLGLGLAICDGLVRLMGGVIVAEGEPGRGASFRIDLPLPLVLAHRAA